MLLVSRVSALVGFFVDVESEKRKRRTGLCARRTYTHTRGKNRLVLLWFVSYRGGERSPKNDERPSPKFTQIKAKLLESVRLLLSKEQSHTIFHRDWFPFNARFTQGEGHDDNVYTIKLHVTCQWWVSVVKRQEITGIVLLYWKIFIGTFSFSNQPVNTQKLRSRNTPMRRYVTRFFQEFSCGSYNL